MDESIKNLMTPKSEKEILKSFEIDNGIMFAVIGEWTDIFGEKKWDILNPKNSPMSYDDALNYKKVMGMFKYKHLKDRKEYILTWKDYVKKAIKEEKY